MAEELKETREEFEKELEASLEKAETNESATWAHLEHCLLYTSPSPRD